MIKSALSEIREMSSSSEEEIVNGKRKAAAISSDAYTKNGKGVKITTADTNKTKPISVLEKLAKQTEELEPGDILLMSSMKIPGTINRIIRAGSTATQAGLNHAAVYVGNGKIVEGRANRGIKELSLTKGTKGLSYTVVRPNLPRRVRNRAASIAKKQVGKEYSSKDLVQTGALLGLVPDSLRTKLLSPDTESIDDANAMQCAALIAGSYQKAGKNITGTSFKYVAPVDLLSKTDSSIVKMKKAKNDLTQGTPFSFTASAEKAKEKLNTYMSKTASAGHISMFCHVDATEWCPNGDVIEMLSKFFTKEVRVEIYPRYLVNTVWEKDHPCETYSKEYYAFRAYAGKDYCRIFVDETETKDSVLWVMLHELAHIALATSPFLFKGYRHLTPDDYHCSDDAHERDPEEQMANEIAMSWMDMLGYGKVSYPRHWWRNRTMMNKKASIRDKLMDFADTLRGKNVDRAREALSSASSSMQDSLRDIRNTQQQQRDVQHALYGNDGLYDTLHNQLEVEHGPGSVTIRDVLNNPSGYSPKIQEISEKFKDAESSMADSIIKLKGGYSGEAMIPVPPDISALQSGLTDAQKATDIARMQAAGGVGTLGMAGAYGLGRLNNNKHEKNTMRKQANYMTKALDMLRENKEMGQYGAAGAGMLGLGALAKGTANSISKGKDEDIQAMLAGKPLTDEQRSTRRKKRIAGTAAKGVAGAVTGGLLGSGLYKAKRILPDIVKDSVGEFNDGVADLKGELDDFGISDLLFKRDSRLGRFLNSRFMRKNAPDAADMADGRRVRRSKAGRESAVNAAEEMEDTVDKMASVSTSYPYLRAYYAELNRSR